MQTSRGITPRPISESAGNELVLERFFFHVERTSCVAGPRDHRVVTALGWSFAKIYGMCLVWCASLQQVRDYSAARRGDNEIRNLAHARGSQVSNKAASATVPCIATVNTLVPVRRRAL